MDLESVIACRGPVCRTLGLFLAALIVVCPTATAQRAQWHLVDTVSNPKAKPIQGDSFFTVVTNNPRLSGEIHFSDDLQDVRFHLFRNGRLAWEAPCPSDVVLIPSHVDIVIMVGKRPGEAPIRDGKNTYEGFIVYNARGRELASIDTGPLGPNHLFPGGRLLYVSSGAISLRDFSDRGRLIWQIERSAPRIFVHNDEYFSIRDSTSAPGRYVTTLYEVATGRSLASFTDVPDIRPEFFAISTDGAYAFLRTRNPGSHLQHVSVFRIGSWDHPVETIARVPGLPFAADRHPASHHIAIGYAIVPQPGFPR